LGGLVYLKNLEKKLKKKKNLKNIIIFIFMVLIKLKLKKLIKWFLERKTTFFKRNLFITNEV
jgi:hypothetical protein